MHLQRYSAEYKSTDITNNRKRCKYLVSEIGTEEDFHARKYAVIEIMKTFTGIQRSHQREPAR